MNSHDKSASLLRLISLNVWGGQILNPLLEFIHYHRNVDFFSFQEIYSRTQKGIVSKPGESICTDLFERIADILPNHIALFRIFCNSSCRSVEI